MLNDLTEFLFCPVHGILSPARWSQLMPLMAPAVTAGILLVRRCFEKAPHD